MGKRERRRGTVGELAVLDGTLGVHHVFYIIWITVNEGGVCRPRPASQDLSDVCERFGIRHVELEWRTPVGHPAEVKAF